MGCPLSVQAGASRWGWCSTTPRSTWPTTFPGEFRLNAKVGAEPGRGCQTQGTERSGGVMRPGPGPVPEHDPRAVQRYRAKVLDRIVAACADGSLDPSELAARSEAAQQASTLPGLNAVIADIPGPARILTRIRRPDSRRARPGRCARDRAG